MPGKRRPMPEIITRPSIEIDQDLLEELKALTREEGQVVVHCLYNNLHPLFESQIRIWPSTYLFDKGSPHRSELVHTEHITLAPEWTVVPGFSSWFFTLIFSGLPASCTLFDLIEDCHGGSGAFIVQNIHRNSNDVYYVRI